MSKKVTLPVTFILIILANFYSRAGKTISLSVPIPNLINTWYEEPELSSGDTVVFTLTKHVLQPWDNPAYEFAQLKFFDAGNFTVAYWRWCATYNWTYNATYTTPFANVAHLDFGPAKCKNKLQIVSVSPTLLKVIITEE
jgi:hypothetical protein